MKTLQELKDIKAAKGGQVDIRFNPDTAEEAVKSYVLVCGGTGCTSNHSWEIMDELRKLIAAAGKKDEIHHYRDIVGQKLYLIQGGNIVVELHMADGSAVSVQSSFEGVYPFLDTAFAGWCLQTGRDPQSCDFHDPSQSLWFPAVEDI